MDRSLLPKEWQDAFRRDLVEKPAFPDPLPERRLARLLAAFVIAGLFFMTLPGTVLGVWNLVGISSQRGLAAVSTSWIQAHGHAQLFGWVGTFIFGISLYTLPKFRGSLCRSVPVGWGIWVMWTGGVGLRWFAGIQNGIPQWEFGLAAGLEFLAAILLVWEVTGSGTNRRSGQAWEAPVFFGLAALCVLLGWQMLLSISPLTSPALPATTDRILISLAIWAFGFPVVVGYSAKFFPGLLGTVPPSRDGLRLAVAFVAAAGVAFAIERPAPAAAATLIASIVAIWSLRLFQRCPGNPKRSGVYEGYPIFARLAYIWLLIAALLGFGISHPGVLGASRHAFTVGFLATLIFSIGPRILPSFLNSRELWSPRLMRLFLMLITAGCALRVISEPLAYGETAAAAWKALPVSAFAELLAVLLFGSNLAMSLATPIPAWFGREHVNDRMSLYWLVSSYPATRKILTANGLRTLGHADAVPKTLALSEAAHADGVASEILIAALGDFFESRFPRSLRQPLRASESIRSTNR
jgi:uncharacterized protein involved in response to NO